MLAGTLTDQAVSLEYPAVLHWGSAPRANLLGVDTGGDPLFESGWWYRAEGDTREYPLPQPDSETYVLGKLEATWNNLDGKGFEVTETTYVFDREGPSGGFMTLLAVRNNNASPRAFTFFHYLDPDMNGTSTGDSGSRLATSAFAFTDASGNRGVYRSKGNFHYQVSAYSDLRTALNDTALTNLSDSGLPFGPGDATAAVQFGPSTIPPGGAWGGWVSFFVNPAVDQIKGDVYGIMGFPPIFGQGAQLDIASFYWMRRTVALDRYTGLSTAGRMFSGVADFGGDLKDELITRDPVTGAVYIDGDALFGAPTLALNWKLSATGDFDGDGRADILWRNTTSQKLVIWTMSYNTRIGTILPEPGQAAHANWEVSGAGDFNGDGFRDILWYNQTTGKLVIWYMDGSVHRIAGGFTTPDGVGNNNWKVVAVGDYGRGPGGVYDTQDIVWQNDTSSKIVVWHMDGDGGRTSGVFTVPDSLPAGYKVVGPR